VRLLLGLMIFISHHTHSSISLSNVSEYIKYAPKDNFNSNYIQGTTGSTVCMKLNLSYHLIQRLVVPSSKWRMLLSTLARGRNMGDNPSSSGRVRLS
jgi:hypothetical protein